MRTDFVDFLLHSGTIDQKIGEIWTAQLLLQPTPPKSDRLLGCHATVMHSVRIKPGSGNGVREGLFMRNQDEKKRCDEHSVFSVMANRSQGKS